MRVVSLDTFGLTSLRIAERPMPEPKRGEVLVNLKAVSLNYRDLLMVMGIYNPRQTLPLIPCSDGAGDVSDVGDGVTAFKKGDRVSPIFAQRWWAGAPEPSALRSTLGGPLDGTLCEYMVVPQEALVRIPAHLSYEEAATLPCAALTAWSALVTYGGIRAGETVLTQGTGGVSLFALQLARLHGAQVIATSGSDAKLSKLRELGAAEVINYREDQEWGKTIRKWTHDRGVDHIVEVGGAQTLQQSLRAIKVGGVISVIGILSGRSAEIDIAPILMQNVRVQGILVGSREGFEAMNRAIALHHLHPIIDRVFALDEISDAFAYLQSGQHFGKICIKIS